MTSLLSTVIKSCGLKLSNIVWITVRMGNAFLLPLLHLSAILLSNVHFFDRCVYITVTESLWGA